MGLVSNIILLIIVVVFVAIFYPTIMLTMRVIWSFITNSGFGPSPNFPNYTQSNQTVESGPLIDYTLHLINVDRDKYGLGNVTLSPETSGQQHAISMLENNYFSHWDIYGMKPYMRYTLVGGLGAVQENVAYMKSGEKACIGSACTNVGKINVTSSIEKMEYNMMYNDSICCNNGHRDNILDPNHNQVSIGVAYNGTSVYLVEDFVNNYINWLNDTPSINASDEVALKGTAAPGYKLSSIEISYDTPVLNMSTPQLDSTSEYSYGPTIAGVVASSLNYYPSITTIVADKYYSNGENFMVSFNLEKLIKGNGAGEYTVMVWLNGTSTNSSFVGSTYTIFVNQNGTVYKPTVV